MVENDTGSGGERETGKVILREIGADGRLLREHGTGKWAVARSILGRTVIFSQLADKPGLCGRFEMPPGGRIEIAAV